MHKQHLETNIFQWKTQKDPEEMLPKTSAPILDVAAGVNMSSSGDTSIFLCRAWGSDDMASRTAAMNPFKDNFGAKAIGMERKRVAIPVRHEKQMVNAVLVWAGQHCLHVEACFLASLQGSMTIILLCRTQM